MLSVSTNTGAIYSHLMKVPCLSAHNDTKVVSLTSLRELAIVDTATEDPPLTIKIAAEPTFVALGALLPFPPAARRRPYSTALPIQPPRDSHRRWRSAAGLSTSAVGVA